jgi:hypothetical protein
VEGAGSKFVVDIAELSRMWLMRTMHGLHVATIRFVNVVKKIFSACRRRETHLTSASIEA